MKSRIEKIMQAKKLTAAGFANILQVQRSSISHILSGRNNPSLEFMQKILHNFPNISPAWLIMGSGTMFIHQSPKATDSKVADMFTNTSNIKQKNTTENESLLEKNTIKEKQISNNDFQNNQSAPPPFIQNKKAIEKIIVFYTDKTFEIYNQHQPT